MTSANLLIVRDEIDNMHTSVKKEKAEVDASAYSDLLETVNCDMSWNLAEPAYFYNSGNAKMSRFVKLIDSEKASWLLQNHPNAFLLLTLIALRARRINGHLDGLEIGDAFIGDYKAAGIETERKYRTAKQKLIDLKIIRIRETCRNRKKSTTGATTVGTLVTLIDSSIWDINPKVNDDRSDDRPTTDRRPTDDEQERTKKEEERTKKNINPYTSRSAPQSRNNDNLKFSFESMQFEGVTAEDVEAWKVAYPNIDISQQIAKAAEWVKSNESKTRKRTQWRKFLTQTWFSRADERAMNRAASGYAGQPKVDRRQRDSDGTPLRSSAEGMF